VAAAPGELGLVVAVVEVPVDDDDDDEVQCMYARVLPKSLWTILALAAVAAANDTASMTTNLPTILSLASEVNGTDPLPPLLCLPGKPECRLPATLNGGEVITPVAGLGSADLVGWRDSGFPREKSQEKGPRKRASPGISPAARPQRALLKV
jgi:hypothetical protein